MVGGSIRMPNSGSVTVAATALQEEEDYDNMDDELEHLADPEEVLCQELDSVHVVADPAVTSPRLSSTSLLLEEEIDEGGGNEDDHDSLIKEEETVDHDGRCNDNNNTMEFLSILPVGDSIDTFSDDEEEVAKLKSLLFPETLKREMDTSPPRPQDHDYKDEAGTDVHQSETPASPDINTCSDDEPAQRSQFSEHQLAELKYLFFSKEFRKEMNSSPP
eukprot:scaffold1173_cov37-Attheya_sp.AAC.4